MRDLILQLSKVRFIQQSQGRVEPGDHTN
jgi:hypothetical protein